MNVKTRKVLRKLFSTPVGIYVMRFIIFQFNRMENIYLSWRQEQATVALIQKVGKETKLLVTNNEAFQIYSSARAATKIKGDYAEVGVYQGGSSKLICEAKGDKSLYLFDTFEGLPPKSKYDEFLESGQFSASYEKVKEYLQSYKHTYLYKGLFPESGETIKDKEFAFVHLDVDFYQSTLDSLEFFYTRMNRGGIMLSHDYSTLPGVRKAFDDFYSDKPETIIALPTSQCLVVKL